MNEKIYLYYSDLQVTSSNSQRQGKGPRDSENQCKVHMPICLEDSAPGTGATTWVCRIRPRSYL